MTGKATLSAGLALAAMTIAAAYWAQQPTPGAPCQAPSDGVCSNCHRGSVPMTHTAEFLGEQHGRPARNDRTLCLGCHDEEDHCQRCHLDQQPEWETDAFRHPGRGPKERREHARIASAHADTCMECHRPKQHAQCAGCHRADEWR